MAGSVLLREDRRLVLGVLGSGSACPASRLLAGAVSAGPWRLARVGQSSARRTGEPGHVEPFARLTGGARVEAGPPGPRRAGAPPAGATGAVGTSRAGP